MGSRRSKWNWGIGSRLVVVIAFAAMGLMGLALPAYAACHIATFSPTTASVAENAGSVVLTVVLQGEQPQCSGTVDYATEPGTAAAGQDYTHVQGTISFTAGDDRREQITVPILDDATPEGEERFQVRLSGQTGTIAQVGNPAIVTIQDNDTAAAPPPAATSPARSSPSPSPPPGPSPEPSPEESPAEEATETVEEETSPTSTVTTQALDDIEDDGDGGMSTPLKIALGALGLGAVAGGALYWMHRRSGPGPA